MQSKLRIDDRAFIAYPVTPSGFGDDKKFRFEYGDDSYVPYPMVDKVKDKNADAGDVFVIVDERQAGTAKNRSELPRVSPSFNSMKVFRADLQKGFEDFKSFLAAIGFQQAFGGLDRPVYNDELDLGNDASSYFDRSRKPNLDGRPPAHGSEKKFLKVVQHMAVFNHTTAVAGLCKATQDGIFMPVKVDNSDTPSLGCVLVGLMSTYNTGSSVIEHMDTIYVTLPPYYHSSAVTDYHLTHKYSHDRHGTRAQPALITEKDLIDMIYNGVVDFVQNNPWVPYGDEMPTVWWHITENDVEPENRKLFVKHMKQRIQSKLPFYFASSRLGVSFTHRCEPTKRLDVLKNNT